MSEHDFDTNGPSEEELRELLRSLPRREAPGDFEPELMRRLAGVRRRRGMLSVLHTGARAEWAGGAVSAAVAAVVVAGAWLVMSTGEPAATAVAPAVMTPPIVAAAPAVAAPRPAVAPSDLAATTQETIENAAAAPAAPPAAAMRSEAPRRASALAGSTRRSAASMGAHRRTPPIVTEHVRMIDTIAATRVQLRATPRPTPTPTEAGSRTAHPEMGTPAPAPMLHGEPTGVDTGGRAR